MTRALVLSIAGAVVARDLRWAVVGVEGSNVLAESRMVMVEVPPCAARKEDGRVAVDGAEDGGLVVGLGKWSLMWSRGVAKKVLRTDCCMPHKAQCLVIKAAG